ncbi:hypothetical protein Cadr_000003620 [Camelus dromedarius]|uniref:Uncharacterized protein n=1 Tax=Camelus dromedarius TaxID=9838 RepID=A0A5N4C261_CAMDR|nr:hypothetical protein Cadr_000003620 [Camelus dromedarius]
MTLASEVRSKLRGWESILDYCLGGSVMEREERGPGSGSLCPCPHSAPYLQVIMGTFSNLSEL